MRPFRPGKGGSRRNVYESIYIINTHALRRGVRLPSLRFPGLCHVSVERGQLGRWTRRVSFDLLGVASTRGELALAVFEGDRCIRKCFADFQSLARDANARQGEASYSYHKQQWPKAFLQPCLRCLSRSLKNISISYAKYL